MLVLQHGRAVALGSIAEIVAERPELAGRPLEDVFLALTGQTEEMAVAAAPAGRSPDAGAAR